MVPVVADTSGLVAIIGADDTTHPVAVAAAEVLALEKTPIIVPAEVYSETLNILGKKVSNLVAIAAGRELLANRTFQVVGPDTDTLAAAVDLLERQKASDSFVDALVMAYADRYGTRRIFGFDAVFARNGYETPVNPHSKK